MASSPPAFEVSKYGLPRFFGRNVMVRFPPPSPPPPPVSPPVPPPPPPPPPPAHPVARSAVLSVIAARPRSRLREDCCPNIVVPFAPSCDRRSTSSGGCALRAPLSSNRGEPLRAEPPKEAGRHHGEDEEHARDDVDDVGGDARQTEGASES